MSRKLTIKPQDRFNKLTIIEEVEPSKSKTYGPRGYREYRTFKCECECGNIVTVLLKCLRSGNTKSCGCQRIESNIKKNKDSNRAEEKQIY